MSQLNNFIVKNGLNVNGSNGISVNGITAIDSSGNVPSARVTWLNTILNDISNQFNGNQSVFPLYVEQTAINTIVDSKDVEVVVNGQRLAPYVTNLTYPWLTPYDSFKGFRIKSGNIIIYNSPDIGDTCFMTVTKSSTSVQTRRYPYSASTIALGD